MILFHFGALLSALAANLSPSYLQGQLTELLSPYSATTSQTYNSIPLELTHAEPFDFPLQVELLPSDEAGEDWQSMLLPGSHSRVPNSLGFRWSRWPNISRVIQLIATDQPDSEILSDIVARLVVIAERQTGRTFRAVRLRTPKVLSYDDDALLASGQTSLQDNDPSVEVAYRATIIRESERDISLIPEQLPLRTAKPVREQRERP